MKSFWDDGGGWWRYTNKALNYSYNQAPWPGDTAISVAPVSTPKWQPSRDPGPVIHTNVNAVVRGPIAGVDYSFPKGSQFQPIHGTIVSPAIYHPKSTTSRVRFTALQPVHHLRAILPSRWQTLGITPAIATPLGSLFRKRDRFGPANASVVFGRKTARPARAPKARPQLTSKDLYEGGIFEGLLKLSGKVGSGRSTGSIYKDTKKFDHDFWELWLVDNDEHGNPVLDEKKRERLLQLKLAELAPGRFGWASDRTPADAIAAIFAHPEKWKFDCGEFVQAVELYAILKALGYRGFNDRIRNVGQFGVVFRFKEQHSTGLIIVNGWQREKDGTFTHFTEEHQGGKPVKKANMEKALAGAPVGSHVTFHNPLDTKGTPWRNEHAIKLGPDLYYAHGVSRIPVSRRVIETRLAEEYVKSAREDGVEATVKAVLGKIYIGGVATYKIN